MAKMEYLQKRTLCFVLNDFESDHETLLNKALREKGPYFPANVLNTERYSAYFHIQSECEKTWTRKTPNTDTFHPTNLVNAQWKLED